MIRRRARIPLVIASLVALLSMAVTAVPASAEPERVQTVERYAHKLVNCLRTGGRVTWDGRCRGFGSGQYSEYRAPLEFSNKISNKVAWPWARRTVTASYCGHSLAPSTVDQRFRAVALKHVKNGENIGCHMTRDPRRMVALILRWWQRESAYGGWHWRQIKDPDFQSAGYGIAKRAGGRSHLVVDFYGEVVD